ncbi:MAG: cell division protein FtsQ/DivIB [Gammaproteobacteria bacterium]|jgi:cell division protein FtsQ
MARAETRRRGARRKAEPRFRLRLPQLPAWPWRQLGVGALVLAAVGAAGWGAAVALDRPIRQVLVHGPFERVSVVQVEAALGDLREQGFIGVELDEVRARIAAIEWVDDAVVRRRWPAEVEVTVIEQVPAARWGESGLLNTRGELFVRDSRHVPAELPRLSGPAGSERLVARRYLDTRARLAAVGLGLRALDLDARGAWRMELSNGFDVRLGRESFDERLDRFVRVAAPLLTPRAATVEYVDLRYSRGFAVGWRERVDGGDAETQGNTSNG